MVGAAAERAESLAGALHALFGEGVHVVRKDAVHGGDINCAYALTLSDGTTVFLKTNGVERARVFETEAAGLAALSASGAIGVPRVLSYGTDAAQGFSFLMLEFLAEGEPRADYWERFGHALAALHRAGCAQFSGGKRYGFSCDNFIGATPQQNAPCDSWVEFYRCFRLRPQFALAAGHFCTETRERFERLLAVLPRLMPEPSFPSLLHGDLWSGNALCGPDGNAWLVDPAAYVGSAEADIAMTELFGGFPRRFYDAYRESNPDACTDGWRARADVYHLYHLLNHLNLFGRSYAPAVERIIRAFTA